MLRWEEKGMHLDFFFFFVSYIYACKHDIMQCECAEHRNVTLWLMLKKFQSKHFHTKLIFFHDKFIMECFLLFLTALKYAGLVMVRTWLW